MYYFLAFFGSAFVACLLLCWCFVVLLWFCINTCPEDLLSLKKCTKMPYRLSEMFQCLLLSFIVCCDWFGMAVSCALTSTKIKVNGQLVSPSWKPLQLVGKKLKLSLCFEVLHSYLFFSGPKYHAYYNCFWLIYSFIGLISYLLHLLTVNFFDR